MKLYLADTNVISAISPPRTVTAEFAAWLQANSGRLFLSSVTITEIEDGIAKSRREGASRKADDLARWLEAVVQLYGARILPFGNPAAHIAGAFSDRARGLGHAPGLADIIIAATAAHHGLTILTRNLRHFAPLGVAAVDPFAALP